MLVRTLKQTIKSFALPLSLIAIFCYGSVARAENVTMAFGDHIIPYSFPESDSGIELEIFGEALAYKGHHLVPRYYPLARVPREFTGRRVDAAMTDLGHDMTQAGGHYGNPAVIYDNVFISLRERSLRIRKPADLKGLSVLSFQGADRRYPLWLAPVKAAGNYHETASQNLQVLTLHAGRYDLVLSDRVIFRYFTALMEKQKGLKKKPIKEHRVFDVEHADYRPVFRDPAVRDDFNAGLAYLKKSGRYQQIFESYLND